MPVQGDSGGELGTTVWVLYSSSNKGFVRAYKAHPTPEQLFHSMVTFSTNHLTDLLESGYDCWEWRLGEVEIQ